MLTAICCMEMAASVKPAKVKKSSAKQKAKSANVKEPVDDMYVL